MHLSIDFQSDVKCPKMSHFKYVTQLFKGKAGSDPVTEGGEVPIKVKMGNCIVTLPPLYKAFNDEMAGGREGVLMAAEISRCTSGRIFGFCLPLAAIVT